MTTRVNKDRDAVISPWAKAAYTAKSFPGERHGWRYAHIVRRTLRGVYNYAFQPDSVFYAGAIPAAYIKTVDQFSEPDIRKWQKFLWNQAVVPVLIIKTATQLRVYSAATKPSESKDIQAILETTADALESMKASLETGDFHQEHRDRLTRDHRVDRYLLSSLNATATKIAKSRGGVTAANLDFAHQFLTRILFICYLIERGMIKGRHFPEGHVLRPLRPRKDPEPFLLKNLLEVKDRREAILAIFEHVKTRFNGSLFPKSITAEAREYNEELFDLLLSFLQGQDMESSQLSLGFWAFDFSVIPIEMISCVYDGFLKSQGETAEASGDGNTQRGTGAYYTPPHLAELVADIALEDLDKPVHELTVLDPACGSGVFLVTILGRMADSLRAKYKRTTGLGWGQRILDLLPRLFGADTNPTACHITCFSLYLAALEQMSPNDVETLDRAGKKFPSLLLDAKQGIKDGKNIVRGNFFDPALPLEKADFDLVIGNPPWVSRKKEDEHFLNWRKRGGKADEKRRAPGKHIAHGFMWKAGERLNRSGQACLLLSSGVLLNLQTNEFQASWLKEVTVHRVVNFSDLRWILFEEAAGPCSAIRFSPKPCDDIDHLVRCESPKCDVRSQQGGPVFIREEDTKFLRISDLWAAADSRRAPEVWKSRLWGSPRGVRFLARLWDYPKLDDLCDSTQVRNPARRWLKGQGIIKGNESDSGWWTLNDLFIDAKQLQPLILLPTQCVALKNIDKSDKLGLRAQWPRKKDLFIGPKVMIREGASTLRATFCAHRVLFRDALTSIAGPKRDADYLRFLAVVLGSDFAQHYLFHTSSRWGIERDVVRTEERLRMPFFLPEDASSPGEASAIIAEVAQQMKSFESEMRRTNGGLQLDKAEKLQHQLEGLIQTYYEVDAFEAMLIKDTVDTIIRSSTPGRSADDIRTWKRVSEDQQVVYADTLCDAMAAYCGKDTLGKSSKGPYAATIFRGSPYSIVRVDKVSHPRKTVTEKSPEELRSVLVRLRPLLDQKRGKFIFCQNLKVFCKDALYILKPRQYRFWMRTAALNDADEIAGALLLGRER